MKRILPIIVLSLLVTACGCKKDNGGSTHTPEPTPTTTCERKGSGKDIYISSQLGGDPTKLATKYNYSRSAESENLILFWDEGFGDDPSNAPQLNGKSMNADVEEILKQAEVFYKYFRDDLKFIESGSAADKYKMIIFLTYTQEGTVYGGAEEDYKIGALWVEPSRLTPSQPSGVLDAVAHELGHSFQFQLCLDNGGFEKGGFGSGGVYEITSQWMLWSVNPKWLLDEAYHRESYVAQTYLTIFHPENMYHNADSFEYWASLHGITATADLWRAAKGSNKVVSTYKTLYGLDQAAFCDEYYEGVRKLIYYDIPRIKDAMATYAGVYPNASMTSGSDGWKTISTKQAPQAYGYNTIKLTAPKAGETVSVEFKGDASVSNAGWRYGFVGKTNSGDIVYSDPFSSAEGTATMTASSDMSQLWFVVMGAPATDPGFDGQDTSRLKTYPYSIHVL